MNIGPYSCGQTKSDPLTEPNLELFLTLRNAAEIYTEAS
jgi:hypothetical protein